MGEALELDLFGETICLGDPYPLYRRLRDQAPLYRDPAGRFCALSRYADVLSALRSPDDLTVAGPTGNVIWEIPGISIATLDGPRHARLRERIGRGYTPRRVAELEPGIRARVRGYLEHLAAQGGGEFVREFAAELPGDTVCALVGVPDADAGHVKHLVHALADVALEPSQEEAWKGLFEYFGELRRAKRRHPGDDLISRLLEVEIEGERLTDAELDEFFVLMGQAGQETVQALLGTAVELLERHPEQRCMLAERPERIPAAIEEVLRFDAPTQWLNRTVVRPLELCGEKLERGECLVLLYASANRDERQFPDPDRFDVERRAQAMLSFGHGVHFCLGASLARLMARVALEELLARFPSYRIDRDRAERLRSQGSVMRGFRRLPIETR
jgi:cytochrome P450